MAPRSKAPAAGLPHQVRIIGGRWKRSKLPVADRPGLRPTPDRVRTTLFNWLPHQLDGWRCIDLYAGSGALGFEAASRGASAVALVERDPQLVRSLRDTQQRLHADAVTVHQSDALAWLRARAAQDCELLFIDPPFDAGLFESSLHEAARVVVPGGWIYLEADHALTAEAAAAVACTVHRQGRAGAVHFHLLQRHGLDTGPIA